MSPLTPIAAPPSRTRICALLLAFGSVLAAPPALAQPLSFFKNYFVTGDYDVYGASLFGKGRHGFADAEIRISGFPEDTVDLVAAFLYIQTSEETQWSGIDHARFNGFDLGPGDNSFAKALNWDAATPTCWVTSSPTRRKVTYRADVLRFMPVKDNGKHAVNGAHPISVPDAGAFTLLRNDGDRSDDKTGPWAVGASLVLVYRDPRKPLRAIVIYDGGFRKEPRETMVQPIEFYYDVASVNPAPKMTHIVGIGTPLTERVLVDGALVATNPFRSAAGLLWDNWTTTNFFLPPHDDAMVVTVAGERRPSDCLSYSAMILAVNGEDPDADGLLTRWETSPPPTGPDGQPLPDLAAMGADPLAKDLFVELDYMFAADGTTYGGVAKPAHSHLPKLEAWNMVGRALQNAPVTNPNGTTGIRLHIDAGSEYHDAAGNPLSAYVIPRSLARAGRSISETRACWDDKGTADPEDDELVECRLPDGSQGPIPGQYPAYPGTAGWKTGYVFLRETILGSDRTRKDIFNSILSVHSLGIPKEACQNADGTSNLACETTNPDFHVPRTYSGIHDFPGGDGMLSLGPFDDEEGLPVGTTNMQAGTLLHELGHGFEFTHGGPQVLDPSVPRRENCMPYYHSAMNYLYQFGLKDESGVVHTDFSGEAIDLLDESVLSDGVLLPLPPGAVRYRSSWYAPKAGSYLDVLGKAATKHCDGSPLLTETLPDGTVIFTEPPMVRVDGVDVGGALDWQANSASDAGFAQDINFNGQLTNLGASANDWANIRLNQVGGRRSVGGYYVDLQGRKAVGPMSLDIGRGDIGRGDIGRGDIGRGDIGRGDIGVAVGRGDIGRGDIGRGDIGRGDIGRGDIGRGDIGRGAFGGGDTDVGAPDEPFVELDVETFRAVHGDAPGPATGLRACLTIQTEGGFICAAEGGGDLPVRLDWDPAEGPAVAYRIFRFAYDPEAAFPPATLPSEAIATVFAPEFGTPPTSYIDFEAPEGDSLAYFVIALFADESTSGISNFATIATPVAPIVGLGSIGDPVGDAEAAGDPDIVSASVQIRGATVRLQVRFAPGTFNPSTSVAQFSLDTDQNPATGHAGTDSGCGADAGVIGSEFIVDFGSDAHGTQAAIRPFVGPGCNAFGTATLTAPGSVVYVADGLDVAFPRSAIGNDDGLLNFKVVSYRFLGEGFTGVLDRATDAGQAPGVVIPQE